MEPLHFYSINLMQLIREVFKGTDFSFQCGRGAVFSNSTGDQQSCD